MSTLLRALFGSLTFATGIACADQSDPENDGGHATTEGTDASEGSQDASGSEPDLPWNEPPTCVGLQQDSANEFNGALAGIVSECEAGPDAPTEGVLHRVEAVECTDAAAVCRSDADCGPQKACLCASAFYRSPTSKAELVRETGCYPASCRTDADCVDAFCGGSLGCGVVTELHCFTAADECRRSADCPDTPGARACYWTDGWICGPEVDCE